MKQFVVISLLMSSLLAVCLGLPVREGLRHGRQVTMPPILSNGLSLSSEVNHDITIDHQNQVLDLGQAVSLGITNTIVRPLTFFNNQISSAASALPGIFAANGAALGTAIAAPIQLGTLAANGLISGVTGTLVSVPISLLSGGTAQVLGLIGTGRQLYQNHFGGDQSETTQSDSAAGFQLPGGEVILQPLAVLTGSNTILAGVGLKSISDGIQNIGQRVQEFGGQVSSAGTNTSSLGKKLIGWTNGHAVYVSTEPTTEGIITLALGSESTTEMPQTTMSPSAMDDSFSTVLSDSSIATSSSENNLSTENDTDSTSNYMSSTMLSA